MMAMIEIGNNMDFSEKFFSFILIPSLKNPEIFLITKTIIAQIPRFIKPLWQKNNSNFVWKKDHAYSDCVELV